MCLGCLTQIQMAILVRYILSLSKNMVKIKKNRFKDFQEFLLSISITSTNSNYKKKLEWVFNLYDIDGNGSIDKNEFRTIVCSIYKVLDTKNKKRNSLELDENLNETFKKIDTDGSKTICLDEFVEACTKDKYLLDLLAPSI